MKGTFDLLEQVPDVVQAESGPEAPEIAGLHREALTHPRGGRARQTAAQRVVDHVAEGPARSARERRELGCHILIEGQRCAHAVMLMDRHHDVKRAAGERPCVIVEGHGYVTVTRVAADPDPDFVVSCPFVAEAEIVYEPRHSTRLHFGRPSCHLWRFGRRRLGPGRKRSTAQAQTLHRVGKSVQHRAREARQL